MSPEPHNVIPVNPWLRNLPAVRRRLQPANSLRAQLYAVAPWPAHHGNPKQVLSTNCR